MRPVCIVTGGNTGIGYQTCKRLANEGYDVIMACRDMEKGSEAAMSLRKLIKDKCSIEVFHLDLASLSSVSTFVNKVFIKYDFIDILVNNAGMNLIGHKGVTVTEDNLDIIFQVNYLAPFFLTLLLIDKCKNKGIREIRIVNVTSVMHRFIHEPITFKPSNNYAISKLGNILFSNTLERKIPKEYKIKCVSVNPGFVYSDIWRGMGQCMKYILRFICLTTEQGCQTSVFGALSPSLKGGEYISPYYIPSYSFIIPSMLFDIHGYFYGPCIRSSSIESRNRNIQEDLWQLSVKLIKERGFFLPSFS